MCTLTQFLFLSWVFPMLKGIIAIMIEMKRDDYDDYNDYNHEAQHGVDLCEYGGHDISYIIVLTWSQFMPTV